MSQLNEVMRQVIKESLDFDQQVAKVKKQLAAAKAKGEVTLTFLYNGKEETGRYNGLMNKDGYSYAKVEGAKSANGAMIIVPLTSIVKIN